MQYLARIYKTRPHINISVHSSSNKQPPETKTAKRRKAKITPALFFHSIYLADRQKANEMFDFHIISRKVLRIGERMMDCARINHFHGKWGDVRVFPSIKLFRDRKPIRSVWRWRNYFRICECETAPFDMLYNTRSGTITRFRGDI